MYQCDNVVGYLRQLMSYPCLLLAVNLTDGLVYDFKPETEAENRISHLMFS
jgi:hypothetical protein